HARIAVSHDQGNTWVNDQEVGTEFGLTNMTFPEVVAGDDNRAAYAFLGTKVPGDYTDQANYPQDAPWHLYIATTFDGGVTWTTIDATPTDPVQRGSICNLGRQLATGTIRTTATCSTSWMQPLMRKGGHSSVTRTAVSARASITQWACIPTRTPPWRRLRGKRAASACLRPSIRIRPSHSRPRRRALIACRTRARASCASSGLRPTTAARRSLVITCSGAPRTART